METCKVSYVWTKEKVLKAVRSHYRMQMRPIFWWIMNGIAVLVLASSIFLSLTNGFDGGLLLAIGSCFYWLFLQKMLLKWWVIRNFRESPSANKNVTFEISEQQIAQECEGIISFQANWKIISKVVASPEGLLIYTFPKNTFFWFPYDAFETPQCIEKVKEFARGNDVKIIEAKR